MANEDLEKYIQKARLQGIKDDAIKAELMKTGWNENEVSEAFSTKPFSALPPPPAPRLGMWIAFEYILTIISLYFLAISFALTLHFLVDKWLPGIPTDVYSRYQFDYQSTFLRWMLAILIVSTPMFSFFFLDVTKRIIQNPNIRSLRLRKILIYLTLMGTFLFLMYSITKTIYSFLSGNVSLNFIIHFLITSGVSTIIFAYYLSEVKEDRKRA